MNTLCEERKNILKKKKVAEHIRNETEKYSTILCIEYKGSNTKILAGIRETVKATGSKILIAKNTIMKKALLGKSFEKISESLKGQNCFIFTNDVIKVGSSLLAYYSKNRKKMNPINFVSCIENDSIIDEPTLKQLFKFRTREGLCAALLRTMFLPIKQLEIIASAQIKS